MEIRMGNLEIEVRLIVKPYQQKAFGGERVGKVIRVLSGKAAHEDGSQKKLFLVKVNHKHYWLGESSIVDADQIATQLLSSSYTD
jgi:hypothetical protein